MSKKNKKAGNSEGKVEATKTAHQRTTNELTEEHLEKVAGGIASLQAIQGEDTSKENGKDIELLSYSFGVTSSEKVTKR